MEVLPLYLDGSVVTLALLGGLTIQIGWHAEVHPSEIACNVAEEFAFRPIVAHSTSWRHEPGKLIVTYATLVEPPPSLPPMLRAHAIGRAELARGSALRAPKVIDVDQVVEHALRHFSWLSRDDEHVRAALPEPWVRALAAYPPEPFRTFEGE
ncbi:MAG TPA: hypothetical protein VGB83_03980 [Actinomycetota bacterium]